MTDPWVILSLISAFTLATSDALTKRALRGANEYLVAWFRLIFSMPLLLLIFFLIPVPKLDAVFFKAFLLALPLEAATVILYVKALNRSPLSLTLPFLSFTPVFLIGISYLILGETVSIRGAIGILLIAAGSYIVNIGDMRKGILEPIRSLWKERGALMMLGVALIYGFTGPLGKMAIEHSSPLFFGFTYFTALTVIFSPIALWYGRADLKNLFAQGSYKRMMAPGILYSCMIISHMIAISLVQVAYMISVKRISILIGVVYGYLIFKETNIRERLFGALLMVAGFAAIVTAP
ncbi:MAG: DMT family transporter [Nitrospirota bacterium]